MFALIGLAVAVTSALALDFATGSLVHSLRLLGIPVGGFWIGQACGVGVSIGAARAAERPRTNAPMGALLGVLGFLGIYALLYELTDVKAEPCVYATCIPDTPCESERCAPAGFVDYLTYQAGRRSLTRLSGWESLESSVRISTAQTSRARPGSWLTLEALAFVIGSCLAASTPLRRIPTLLNRELFATLLLGPVALLVSAKGILRSPGGAVFLVGALALSIVYGAAKVFAQNRRAGSASSELAVLFRRVFLVVSIGLAAFVLWKVMVITRPISPRPIAQGPILDDFGDEGMIPQAKESSRER